MSNILLIWINQFPIKMIGCASKSIKRKSIKKIGFFILKDWFAEIDSESLDIPRQKCSLSIRCNENVSTESCARNAVRTRARIYREPVLSQLLRYAKSPTRFDRIWFGPFAQPWSIAIYLQTPRRALPPSHLQFSRGQLPRVAYRVEDRPTPFTFARMFART